MTIPEYEIVPKMCAPERIDAASFGKLSTSGGVVALKAAQQYPARLNYRGLSEDFDTGSGEDEASRDLKLAKEAINREAARGQGEQ